MADLAVYTGVPREQSAIRKFFNKHMTREKAVKSAFQAANVLRQGSESVLVGGALGVAHARLQNGLDYVVKPAQAAGATKMPDGTLSPAKEAITMPIDGAAALAGLGGAILIAEHEAATDLRNAGAAAAAVFGFRKGADFMAAKMRKANQASGGTVPSAKSIIHSAMQAQAAGAAVHGESGFGAEEDPIIALAAGL